MKKESEGHAMLSLTDQEKIDLDKIALRVLGIKNRGGSAIVRYWINQNNANNLVSRVDTASFKAVQALYLGRNGSLVDIPFISESCKGEKCSVCGADATDKLGEEIQSDDPNPNRHNLTAYVCSEHFKMIVG